MKEDEIQKLVDEFTKLNPDANFRMGNPEFDEKSTERIFCDRPIKELTLPDEYTYDGKESITNGHITLAIQDLSIADPSKLIDENQKIKLRGVTEPETIKFANDYIKRTGILPTDPAFPLSVKMRTIEEVDGKKSESIIKSFETREEVEEYMRANKIENNTEYTIKEPSHGKTAKKIILENESKAKIMEYLLSQGIDEKKLREQGYKVSERINRDKETQIFVAGSEEEIIAFCNENGIEYPFSLKDSPFRIVKEEAYEPTQIKKVKKPVVNERNQNIEFDDADRLGSFIDYCNKHGIKRKDGQELKWGQVIPDAIYVGENGEEFTLDAIYGGAEGYDDGAFTKYKLIQLVPQMKKVKTAVINERNQNIEFDDADRLGSFIDYCNKHGIKRKDGQELKWGQVIPDAIYVGENGEEFTLDAIYGGAEGYDDGAFTEYRLMKIETKANTEQEEKKKVTRWKLLETPREYTLTQETKEKEKFVLVHETKEPTQKSKTVYDLYEKDGEIGNDEIEKKPDQEIKTTFYEVFSKVYDDELPVGRDKKKMFAANRKVFMGISKFLPHDADDRERGMNALPNALAVIGNPFSTLWNKIFYKKKAQQNLDRYLKVEKAIFDLSPEEFAILTQRAEDVPEKAEWDRYQLDSDRMRSDKINVTFLEIIQKRLNSDMDLKIQELNNQIEQYSMMEQQIKAELQQKKLSSAEINMLNQQREMIKRKQALCYNGITKCNERKDLFKAGIEHRGSRYNDTVGHKSEGSRKRNPKNKKSIEQLGIYSQKMREAYNRGDMEEVTRIEEERENFRGSKVKMEKHLTLFAPNKNDVTSVGELDPDEQKVLGRDSILESGAKKTIVALGQAAIMASIANNAVNAMYTNYVNETNAEISKLGRTKVSETKEINVPDSAKAIQENDAKSGLLGHTTQEYNDMAENGFRTTGPAYRASQQGAHERLTDLAAKGTSEQASQYMMDQVNELAKNTNPSSMYDMVGRQKFISSLQSTGGSAVSEFIEATSQIPREITFETIVPNMGTQYLPFQYDPTLGIVGIGMHAVGQQIDSKNAPKVETTANKLNRGKGSKDSKEQSNER